jgi:hypothetical protein
MNTSTNGAPEMASSSRPDSAYYRWEAAGNPVSVRLNLDVIDRIGADVTNKFTNLTGRGSEIGGVLLGRIANGHNKTFFVEDYELIECAYSDGPLFSLSDESKSMMVEQLHRLKMSSPHSVLGFFRSHTRKNLSLDQNDLALIRDYFPGPDTAFLLIKPFAAKPSTAGFFVWEDGEIRAEESYCQFPFKRAELVVRLPEAIVRGDFDAAAPPLVQNSAHQNTEGALATAPVVRPTRVGRTNAGLHQSLDDIIRQITRDPAEKKLFSAGMDLERERERWSRFALESSIVSQPKSAPAPDPEDTKSLEEEQDWESSGPAPPQPTPVGLVRQPGEAPGPAEAGAEFEQVLTPSPNTAFNAQADNAANPGWIRMRWTWVLLFVVFLFGGGYVGVHIARATANADEANNALDLRLERDANGLVLRWNRESRVIATARNAVLRIEDGNQSKDFDLNLEQLRFGKVVYFPAGGNVNFRLEVIDVGGSRSVSEWVRASGSSVAAASNWVH